MASQKNRIDAAGQRAALLSKMKEGCLTHPPGARPGQRVWRIPFRSHPRERWMVRAQAVLNLHLVLAAVLWRGLADSQRRGGTADLKEHSRWEEVEAGPGSVYACPARGQNPFFARSPPPSHSRRFLDSRPAQAPTPSAVLVQVPALTCRLLVFPVLGPAHVGRRLTQDLGNQCYLGAFAALCYPVPSESSLN